MQSDAGVNAMVVKLYELFSELFDAESFRISAAFYGDVIDPNRTWEPQPVGDDLVGTSGPPLLTDVMRAVRDTAEVDGDDVVPTILRGAFTRQTQITALDGDPAGGYPMSELGRSIKYYNRPDPLSEAPLSSEDYELICTDVSTWLLDDQTGAEQVFDLIEAREK